MSTLSYALVEIQLDLCWALSYAYLRHFINKSQDSTQNVLQPSW